MLVETRTKERRIDEADVLSIPPTWVKLMGAALIVVGVVMLALAVTSDLFGVGGRGGFGVKQAKIALVGGCTLLTGIGLASSLARKNALEWMLVMLGSLVLIAASIPIENRQTIELGVRQVALPVVATVLVAISVSLMWPWGRTAMGAWRRALDFNWATGVKLLALAAQLGLLILVIRQLDLENSAFSGAILTLTFLGFLVHSLLPMQYRQAFFVLLCFAAVAGVFGFVDGAWLIGLGLLLIGLCHLPLPFGGRVALLLLAGVGLALLRLGWMPVPWSQAVWPILGSMFMFRLIVYLYDLRHAKEPLNLTRTLAYFFLFPNIVFPLFPIVDFTTFRRTYYNEERFRIYQRGIEWMVRGILHLILYRVVSYYLLIGPEDVTDLSELVRYLVSNFLLYLRISGQFHLIIGILHLFGFNLPETHHLYFLATSFTDYWRRINIYWKDFMLKIFYYPAYFQLRKLGTWAGIALATLFVCFCTWLFHAYQWYWIRGDYLLTGPDILFWTILGVLLVINSLYELRQGRRRSLSGQGWSWREISGISLRASATFATMCVLWSLWTSTSISEWVLLWTTTRWSWAGLAWLLGVLALVGGAAGFYAVRERRQGKQGSVETTPLRFWRTASASAAVLGLFYLMGHPLVYGQLAGRPQEVLQDLTVSRLNTQEVKMLERGYYEDLIGVRRFNGALWEIYSKSDQAPPNIWETEVGRDTGDFLGKQLLPSTSIQFHGKVFTTNRWGMRDREYDQQKALGTYRTAFLGSSHLMGWGVADNETFESLLEERLNRENSGRDYSKYEGLNFGAAGYTALQNYLILEKNVVAFEPDVVFYIAHLNEAERVVTHIVERVQAEVEIPYEYVNEIVQQAGIAERTISTATAERRLQPFAHELVSWSYRQLVDACQRRGITPIWVLLPKEMTADPEEISRLTDIASKEGFIVVNLIDLYEGMSYEEFSSYLVSGVDYHPNAKGHQLIANQLYESLRQQSDQIPIGLRQ